MRTPSEPSRSFLKKSTSGELSETADELPQGDSSEPVGRRTLVV
jgi:hypothetical protein